MTEISRALREREAEELWGRVEAFWEKAESQSTVRTEPDIQEVVNSKKAVWWHHLVLCGAILSSIATACLGFVFIHEVRAESQNPLGYLVLATAFSFLALFQWYQYFHPREKRGGHESR